MLDTGLSQTAAASEPITATQALTGAVLVPVTAPLTTTVFPTSTASAPEAAVSTPPLLAMSADPFQVLPGGVITYSVAITNMADAPLTRVVLSDALPAGVVYVAQSGVGFSYSPRDQRLTWAIERIEPGQGLHGGFQLRATGLGIGQLITNTVSAASASTPVVTASAVVEIAPPRQNRVIATPAEGAWLRSEDGRVDLRAPAGAVRGRTEIRYSPARLDVPQHILYAFDLAASDEAGQAVTQFEQPLALSAFFDPQQLPPGALRRLALFHLSEESGEWEAVPSQIDVRWQWVTASVEHFSAYGLGLAAAETVPNFSVDRMTAVRGAQTSLYNGSITFSHGFDLPPGRGGLTPLLGLSYNSANHSQQQGHYSYVGHGWGLAGADYVQRDPPSGKITLVLGGQAYTLQGYGGGWFVKENPLIKVAYAEHRDPYFDTPNWARWTVNMPDGVVYTYSGRVRRQNNHLYFDEPMTFGWDCTPQGNGGEWRQLWWERIPLTRVEDRHGNQINYTWSYEVSYHDQMPYGCYPSLPDMFVHIRAVRLASISYNSGRSGAVLSYASRLDRPAGYDSDNTWRFYTALRLTSVAVQAVWNGQSSATTLRSYGLNHLDQGDPAHPRSQKLLNLMTVQEQAGSRSIQTSFDYSGYAAAWPCTYRYLTKVQNAFGGVVEFAATGGVSANSHADCSSGNQIYWRPPAVTARTERDAITGASATWAYSGVNWNDEAHGFARVWVTAPDSQSCQIREFFQMTQINGQARNHLAGRSNKSSTCTACTAGGACVSNGELGRSETDWSHSSADLPLPNYSALPEQDRPRFVWAAESRIYESRFNDNGTLAAAGTPIKRTTYEYQPARQVGNLSGAKQFGNLSSIKEYQGTWTGFEAAPLRAKVMQYRPNESTWVIGKPAITQLYSGNEATLIAETRLYYDNNSSHTTAPNEGLLTKQETMAVLNGAYQSNPASKTRRFRYYANGNLEWQRDEFDRQTTFYYDGWYQAYPVCQVNPLGHQAKTTFYGVPGDGTCNTANGSTSNVFNRFGQPEKQWDANNALSEYRYDDLGWMTAMAVAPDAIGAPTVRREFRSLGSIGANQPFWLHQQQRDNNGGDNTLHTWTYYDGFGRVLQTKAEADNSGSTARHVETSFDYTWRDGVWRAGVPRFVNGNVAVAGTAAPAYSPPNWNAAGQDETVHTYDRLGRLSVTAAPNNTQVHRYYNVIPDAQNRSHTGVAVIDEANRQTIHQTDPFGRLVVAKQYTNSYASGPNWTEAAYAQVRYDYNVADQLVTVAGVDPDGTGPMPRPTTQISYDGFGQKASITDPDMGPWSYGYDSAGNLARQTDARNQRTCFYYDNLNRLKGKTYSTGTAACPADPGSYTASYSYDAGPNGKGRRTGMADPSGSTAWEYDARGRMFAEHKAIDGWSVMNPNPANRRWVYDSMDRLRELFVNEADGFYYQYDAAGRLQQVYRLGGETVTMSYNARGQITERRLGYQSGISYPELRQTYTYSSSVNFRLTNLRSEYNNPNYNNLQNISYTYDNVGNVLTIQDSAAHGGNQTQIFTYDALNRLSTARAEGGSYGAYTQQSYGYNNAGNMTTMAGMALRYLNQDHPHAITHVGGTGQTNQKYWYDANGNATRRIHGSQDITLGYDAENRLTSITGSGINATYVYDGNGQLVKSVVNGLTSFYPSPELEVIETAPGVFREKYYMIVGGARLSVQDRSAWPPVKNYWLLGDHLGSTAITVDGTTGNRVTELRYYPYGSARYDAGSQLTNYWFTGQRREASTGLYFYQSRWYDPVVGRFLSPDTIVPAPGNPQALNRYSYVLNNPIKYRDPSGHWVETAWDIANVAWSIYEVKRDPSLLNIGALVVDVAAMALPFVPAGMGLVVRGGKTGGKLVAHGDEAANAARWAGHLGDGTHAVLTASRLRQVGAHSDEGARLVKALAEQSTRGKGNRVVLGEWIENGGYVAEAIKNGGIYFETADGVYDALGRNGELAWTVNEQFLRSQLESGIDRIVLHGFASPVQALDVLSKGRALRKEIEYLLRHAAEYGYLLEGNAWIRR